MKIYPHPVNPQDYPAYHIRFAKAVTREDLDNRIGFTTLRIFTIQDNKLVDFQRDLDIYTLEHELGQIIWPVYPTLFAENFGELVEEIAARGLWLYDFWGYVPGSQPAPGSIWGEYSPPAEAYRCLKEKLGPRFMGFNNGEQDGRYMSYASRQCPAPLNRTKQYAAFQAHFEKLGNHLHNNLSVLASLTFLHPFAKEGNTILLGAETGQALPCANMWYSFIRGAGKQYGLIWVGNASIFNRWGYKCYEGMNDESGYEVGPLAGTSLSLLRRLLFVEYMYNSDILGFESSWIIEDNTEKRLSAQKTEYQSAKEVHLSPVGKIQQQMVRYVKEKGRPGILHTPVTIYLDFFSGWVPARHLYSDRLYEVWGSSPYSMGDHQLHTLFEMLYPGYEDAGFFRSERGFLTPTPYGDIADVTSSDTSAENLNRYNLVFVFGQTQLDYESFYKLRKFAMQGGHVVLTIEKLLEADWDITPVLQTFGILEIGKKQILCTPEVEVGGKAIKSASFELVEVLPAQTAVLEATAGGKPYILTQPCGKGKITLICSPYGLEKNPYFDPHVKNETNRIIQPPYQFQPGVKAYLETLLLSQLLFRVNNPLLQFMVNIKSEREYLLLVVNNTHSPQRFDIMDGALQVSRIHQETLPSVPHEEPGWLPQSQWLEIPASTGSGKYEVAAGDYCLFHITAQTAAVLMEPALPSGPNEKLYIAIDTPSVKEYLLAHPSFSNYFGGVKIPASALERLDEKTVQAEAQWVKRQKVDVMVDFTGLLDHYPNISLLYNIPGRTEEGLNRIRSILHKAEYYSTTKAILSFQRHAENALSIEKAEEHFRRALTEIAAMAEEKGITLYLQNSRSLKEHTSFSTFKEARETAQQLGFKSALNVGHSLALGENLETAAPDGILLNAPMKDVFGQMTDAHLPIYQSEYKDELKKWAFRSADFICLDSVYESWNQTAMDLEVLLEAGHQ